MKNENILNKLLIILGIILGILFLFYISENLGDRSNDKSASNIKPEGEVSGNDSSNTGDNPLITEKWDSKEQKKVEKISFSKFKEKLSKKELSVIMLSTDSCYWCINQKPVLEHFVYLNPDVNINILDLSYLTQDDFEYLGSLDSELESIGTPTFISVKNGKVEKVDSGAKNLEGLEIMFKQMGAM